MAKNSKRSPGLYSEALRLSLSDLRRAAANLEQAIKTSRWPATEEYALQSVRVANDLRVLARLARGADS
jgi:hypothetical protein